MAEAKLILPDRKAARELVSIAIDEAYQANNIDNRVSRLIIPWEVNKYITNLIVDTILTPSTEDLNRTMKRLMNNIPKDKVERYERFKQMGDLVLWCNGCIGISIDGVNIPIGQEFYCDAHNIGEKIREPHAPVLGTIAEQMPYYLPVLQRIPYKLNRRSA
jgi:hypothetical protein